MYLCCYNSIVSSPISNDIEYTYINDNNESTPPSLSPTKTIAIIWGNYDEIILDYVSMLLSWQ